MDTPIESVLCAVLRIQPDGVAGLLFWAAESDQEALISFESGLPVANSVTLRNVVSLIVVMASCVKNA